MLLRANNLPVGVKAEARCTGALVSTSQTRVSRSLQVVRNTPENQPGPAASGTVVDEKASSSSQSSMDGADAASTGGKLRRRGTKAESTDAVASFLSRRFGLAGGLAWVGFLTVGTLGEQIKTRMEVASEEQGARDITDAKETVLPNGLRYTDLRIGGGQLPSKGYLVVLDYVAKADGVEFENTKARGKPIVFIYGARPFTGGLCPGVEQALSTMKAGGQRRVVIPPELGFGERGAVLRPTEHVPDKQGIIPANATLEYDLNLVRVSIPPS